MEGYQGPLCQSCDNLGKIWGERYSESFLKPHSCQKCDEQTFVIVLNNLILFGLTFLYIAFILKSISRQIQNKLVGHYLTKSGILFLGTTCLSDSSQIISKILTDYIQITALVSASFSLRLPTTITIPLFLAGDTLSIGSKSIDCLLSQFPSLDPLWFYQVVWSLSMPLIVLFLYFLITLVRYFKGMRSSTSMYHRMIVLFIYLYFFPMVTVILTKSLSCSSIGAKKYFSLDLNVLCGDTQLHLKYVFFFIIPLLLIWVAGIPLILFCKIYKDKMKKRSIFIQIQYAFLFVGYKDNHYYFEFWKMFCKTCLVIASTLLDLNSKYKVPVMNILILFQFYSLMKLKPYKQEYYNRLSQKSTFLCIITLNICSIYSDMMLDNQTTSRLIAVFFAIVVYTYNFIFLLSLIFGLIPSIAISSEKKERNLFQDMLYRLKKIWPLSKIIKTKNKSRFATLLKLRRIQSKFRSFISYLKNKNHQNQEELKSHFGNRTAQSSLPQPSPSCIKEISQRELERQKRDTITSVGGGNEECDVNTDYFNFKTQVGRLESYSRQTKANSPNMILSRPDQTLFEDAMMSTYHSNDFIKPRQESLSAKRDGTFKLRLYSETDS